jgi:ribonucleoside-diphosphate reductase alpha chain
MMKKRVLFTKEDGKQETPLDAYRRVAKFVRGGHEQLTKDNWEREGKRFEKKAVEFMAEGKFMPNTPTLVNSGFERAQCSACFVLPIEDNLQSIYKCHNNQGLIQASGGGTGFFLGDIRPTGAKASGGRFTTRGPVNWLKMLNENATHVAQGMREGANMAILDVGHPDIIEFINCKKHGHNIVPEIISETLGVSLEEAKRIRAVTAIEKFNISISIPNRFMEALARGEDWYFVDPHTGQKTGSMPAQEIWDLIVQNAWENGEPGLFFEDTVNAHNMLPHIGRIRATNPCGEQPRRPYESCNLGHINLSKFVIGSNGSTNFDWTGFEDVIRFGVQFLDDIVEINWFPIPELKEMNLNTRNIGLGIMGWADVLAMMGIPYDSEEAIDKAHEIGTFFKKTVEDETTRLGRDRGNFPYFEGSEFQKSGITHRRNNDTTTVAPTGQTSMYANCNSSIEPIIFPVTKRQQAELVQVEYHPALFNVLKDRGLDTEEIRDKLGNLGSVRKALFLPEDIRSIFPSSHDISYEWHVKHQMAWQKFISSGVSKTINFDKDATTGDIDKAFRMAFEGGCKGITVYRDGSRLNQPLSSLKNGNTHGGLVKITNKRERVTSGTNRKVPNGCGNMMIYVGESDDGRVQELTARLGKGGGCAAAQTEAIARMASIAMQHGAEPAYIAKQLSGIRCHLTAMHKSRHTGDRPRTITSCADAMSVALSEHLANGTKKAEIHSPDNRVGACPGCGGQLSYEEGCCKCYECGFSRC